MPFIKNIPLFAKKGPGIQYGVLYMMGNNTNGKLGTNDITWRSSPVQIGADYAHVSLGVGHTMAIKEDGTLWCWGNNSFGQLGLGNTTSVSSPVQVGSDTNWAYVSAGSQYTLARKQNGTLWAWGANSNGQLGLGDTTNRSSPVQVGTETAWYGPINANNNNHSYALKNFNGEYGELWVWGWNPYGGLGTGDTTSRSSPVQVGFDNTWERIGGGNFYTTATKVVLSTDPETFGQVIGRELWSWGQNSFGQLGLGDTTDRSSPVQIGVDTDWAMVATSWNHTLALKTGGSLYAWGDNFFGQFGNGGTVSRSSPVLVSGATFSWVWAGGNGNSFASNGSSLYVWGYNSAGALGLGNTTNRSSPVQLGTFTKLLVPNEYFIQGPLYMGFDYTGFILTEA